MLERRSLLKTTLLSTVSLAFFSRMAWAQALICKPGVTPRQTSGPFYPTDHLPVDKIDVDADLVALDGHSEKAAGDIVIVEGYVQNQQCQPLKGALVEIWQACASGRYNHEDDPNTAPLDPHFQYWGKAVTDEKGFYRFRTIVPGAYPADVGWTRPPHIHFKVTQKGYYELITQMYFKHESALNAVDEILQALKKSDQEKLIVEFKAKPNQNYPVGQFDIQLKKKI